MNGMRMTRKKYTLNFRATNALYYVKIRKNDFNKIFNYKTTKRFKNFQKLVIMELEVKGFKLHMVIRNY